MIAAFPDDPSVFAGDALTLRVSTDAARFRVDFFRCGASVEHAGHVDGLPGHRAPAQLPHQDWTQQSTGLRGERLDPWAWYRFLVPHRWRAGVYVVALSEGDRPGAVPASATDVLDRRDARALFVVRPHHDAHRPRILYKVPLLTYHAYNRVHPKHHDAATGEGAWSLYTVPPPGVLPRDVPASVSLHRPGGGIGGTPSDMWNRDPFDSSPRQTFAHWDAPFVAWLERRGYDVEFCTDVDLHREQDELLDGCHLLLSAGHDEYWTDAMRRAAETFVANGGNIAFFGGNTCWWRAVFDSGHSFHRDDNWCTIEGSLPENALTGVSFRNGGERDLGDDLTPVGFRVQHHHHWLYAGTGLRDGDVFGDGAHEHLVGYECDGASFDRSALRRGDEVVPDGGDGTPPSFVILGVGDVSGRGWGRGNAAATMGVHTSGGTVFTASTTDWPRVLTSAARSPLEQITCNVIDRLSGSARR
jgi:hypothetical protein